MEQHRTMESSATFPMWLSSSLKSRDKSYSNQSVASCLSKLSIDPQGSSMISPSTSPSVPSEETFHHENHTQLMLGKMNQYYQSTKLKDVTLIAGIININHHNCTFKNSY